MNRLHAELHRLYGPLMGSPTTEPASGLCPGDTDGRLRAAALELGRPADWTALAPLWRGVQADLDLPAPAIAVSGRDAYQLWFSFAQPQPVSQLAAFLDALCQRYLGALPSGRLRCMPAGPGAQGLAHFTLPPQRWAPERWSAFVAPDLAPVFSEEPWLDTEPGEDGQADQLMRLSSIKPAEFEVALQRLGVAQGVAPDVAAQARTAELPTVPTLPGGTPPQQDPRRFLLDVMNDASVALALRIEAAKALLPWTEKGQG